MKCDSCQEKATVFYTQVTNGKLKKFVLCESCAEAQGITSPDGLLIGEDLFGESGSPTDLSAIPEGVATSLTECQTCGFTMENFQKVGRLGCPDCYQAFRGEIFQRLPALHKDVVHRGYLPEGLARQQALKTELADLNERLQAAIDEERFEDAAALRDEIGQLSNPEKEEVSR